MGSPTNYYLVILSLIRIKEELQRVKDPKLQPLITLLQSKTIENIDGCEKIPSHKELAEELGVTQTKCNAWLKKLWMEVRESFQTDPLVVNQVECSILIASDWSENKTLSKLDKEEEDKSFFSINVFLPVIPRIGETIDFELADQNGYHRGTVYKIDHDIIGKQQCITIFAHSYENAYDNW
jgi:hypothetical protein